MAHFYRIYCIEYTKNSINIDTICIVFTEPRYIDYHYPFQTIQVIYRYLQEPGQNGLVTQSLTLFHFQVKLQTKEKRKAQTLKMRPTDKFRVLMESYATMNKTGSNQFKFFFDGEQLDPEKSPEDMDFEDGECIDVF